MSLTFSLHCLKLKGRSTIFLCRNYRNLVFKKKYGAVQETKKNQGSQKSQEI